MKPYVKIFLLLAAAVTVTCVAALSGCTASAAEASSVRIVAGAALSGSMDSYGQQVLEEDIFLRFLQMLQDNHTEPAVSTPAMRKNSALALDLSADLRTAAADILRYAAYRPQEARILPEEPQGDVITVLAEKSSGGLFGAWLFRDPDQEDKSVLAILEDGLPLRQYIYDNDVYKSVLSLLEDRYVSNQVQLEGQYAILRSKYDLAAIAQQREFSPGSFIQTAHGIVWYFNLTDSQGNRTAIVECFSYSGAKSAYTVTIPEEILGIQPYTQESGYDYRLITPSGIRYRSSQSASREKLWRLPESVSLMTPSEEMTGDFDVHRDQLIYAAQDGIYLTDSDGQSRQLVVSHALLKPIMDPDNLIGYTYYFNHPHFTSDGKRAVLSIVTPGSPGQVLGFAVVEVDSFNVKYYTGLAAENISCVHYPSDDLVVALEQDKSHVLNIDSGAQGSISLPGSSRTPYYTTDGSTFVYAEGPVYDNDGKPTTHVYHVTAEEMEQGGQLLLWSSGESFTPHCVTGNYFIGFLEDSRGMLPVAVYYPSAQQSPQEDAPEIVLPEDSTEDPFLNPDAITVIPESEMTDVIVEGPTLDVSSYPSISGDWTWPSISDVNVNSDGLADISSGGFVVNSDGLLEEGLIVSSSPANTTPSRSSSYMPAPSMSSSSSIPMDQRTSSNRPIMPDPSSAPASSNTNPGRLWSADTASAFTTLQELRMLQQLNDMFSDSSSSTGFFNTTDWLTSLRELQDLTGSGTTSSQTDLLSDTDWLNAMMELQGLNSSDSAFSYDQWLLENLGTFW